eukprot:585555-Prymnesium_polylepis.2
MHHAWREGRQIERLEEVCILTQHQPPVKGTTVLPLVVPHEPEADELLLEHDRRLPACLIVVPARRRVSRDEAPRKLEAQRPAARWQRCGDHHDFFAAGRTRTCATSSSCRE